MELVKLLIQASPRKTFLVVVLSLIAGLSGGVLVPLVLRAAESILAGRAYAVCAVLLPAVALVFVIAKRLAQTQAASLTEATLAQIFTSLADAVRGLELEEFEQLDRADIYVKLANAQAIPNAVTKSVDFAQNLITILVCWLYAFWLSPHGGVTILIAALLAVTVVEVFQKMLASLVHQETDNETRIFQLFAHILHGFKELKMNSRKDHDLFDNHLRPLLTAAKAIRTRILFFFSEDVLFLFALPSLVMGVNVFFLGPVYPEGHLLQFVTIVLYLTIPIFIIHDALPYITSGQVALQRLLQITEHIPAEAQAAAALYHPAREPIRRVEEITLEHVQFEYYERDNVPGFSLGPLDLTLRGGEILFIAGGNGSGKSTLVNLLTGLYQPTAGGFTINGKRVNMANHRYLFASVFTDAHLFDSIYGVDQVDAQQVRDLLAQMQLAGKIQWQDDHFSTLALSTGQKKRLALIVALLEDKPIYVFDEWAADQDPQFRRYFYDVLLPAFKAQGKTIVAVTHDDHYYYAADRVIKLEYGQLAAEWTPGPAPETPPQPEPTRRETAAESSEAADSVQDEQDAKTREQPAPEPEAQEPFAHYKQIARDMSLFSLKPAITMVALSGLCETMMLIILYTSIGVAPDQGLDRLFILFVLAFLLFIVFYRRFNKRLFEFIEQQIARIRVQMLERLRQSTLQAFEQVGLDRIYTALTFDVKAISEISHLLSSTVHLGVYTISIFLYVLMLSPAAFVLLSATIALIGAFYSLNQQRIKQIISRVRQQEVQMLGAVNHLFQGFQELRLNDRKNDDFFQRGFCRHVTQFKACKVQAARLFINNYTLSYALWETLILVIVLILPLTGLLTGHLLMTLIGIVFFLPASVLIEHFPRLVVASLSLQRLYRLEHQLERLEREPTEAVVLGEQVQFRQLRYDNIRFRYTGVGQRPFAVGPLTLTLNAGETVFLTGGNGSGKSTLLKLLTGLYHVQAGQVYLNDAPIEMGRYRDLFAPVFTDFHLFDRLYGLPDLDPDRLHSLLHLMQLDDKVNVTPDGVFNTLALSTGQQKRLALIQAMLEEKPIYVFDEWAAEQDPYFRHYFYENLLPAFKAEGKTVLAVTHDDRYFHAADWVLKMEYGILSAD